jgi:dTDP-4-dehydrorhamnose reductase
MWAGLECTVNRTVHGYANQCSRNGHDLRALDDLDLFAALGIQKLRYPVLWESTAPDAGDELNFAPPDARLRRLRELGVDPIVGLLHHGSGPRYTSLIDPLFPEKLAAYAERVAERYPWLLHYTPVNEPLTTARFSGLYGVWFPHARNDGAFIRALYNEVKGTVLAMRAIRKVNPEAVLVQTDDIGRASGTEPVQYQVDFENERRWLTMDLLDGRVIPGHPLYAYLTESGGLGEDELDWLAQNPCPPGIIGVNHYPLSNRFLDHRLELYPQGLRGGNGRDAYADVAAVDTGQADPPTAESVLREVWERYRAPFAVTEAHIAGGREAQLRWLSEIWQSAQRLRGEGLQLEAVTAWSLLGAFDWNTLCTSGDGETRYEPGVFDVRWGRPQPTALAVMVASLAAGGEYEHPLLDRPGYWREPSRVLFAPQTDVDISPPVEPPPWVAPRRRLLIVGAGALGRAFSRVCRQRGIDQVLVSPADFQISSAESVEEWLDELSPWAVIDTCRSGHPVGAEILSRVCFRRGIQLLTFSTASVFDGTGAGPYVESSPVSPVTGWGRSTAEAETRVCLANPNALVVRAGALFGPWDSENFLRMALERLRSGTAVRAAENVIVSPTYLPDLTSVCLDLVADRVAGVMHVANTGALSWADWGRYAASLVGVDHSMVVGSPLSGFYVAPEQSKNRALASERAELMPPLDDALHRFSREFLEGVTR